MKLTLSRRPRPRRTGRWAQDRRHRRRWLRPKTARLRANLPHPRTGHETSVDVPGVARGRRGRLVRRMLVLADLGGLCLAFALALALFRDRVGPADPVGWTREVPLFLVTLPGWVLLARLHGLYDRDEERASHSTLDDLVGVFNLVTVGTFFFFAASWVTGLAKPYPPKLLTFWALAIVFVALARVGARAFARTRDSYVQNAVIVGVDDGGQARRPEGLATTRVRG